MTYTLSLRVMFKLITAKLVSFYFRHVKAVALYAELKALSKGNQ